MKAKNAILNEPTTTLLQVVFTFCSKNKNKK
jgi:hypothetical protein